MNKGFCWRSKPSESPERCCPSSQSWLRGLCRRAAGPRADGVQVTSLLQMLFSPLWPVSPRLRVPFPLCFSPVCKYICRIKDMQKKAAETDESTVNPVFLHWLQMLGKGFSCWGFGSSAPAAELRARARGQPGFLFLVGMKRSRKMEHFPLMSL